MSWSVWEVSWRSWRCQQSKQIRRFRCTSTSCNCGCSGRVWVTFVDFCCFFLGSLRVAFFFSKNRIPRSPTVCFENLFLTPPEGQLSCVHVVNLGSKKNTENTQLLPRVGAAVFFKKNVSLPHHRWSNLPDPPAGYINYLCSVITSSDHLSKTDSSSSLSPTPSPSISFSISRARSRYARSVSARPPVPVTHDSSDAQDSLTHACTFCQGIISDAASSHVNAAYLCAAKAFTIDGTPYPLPDTPFCPSSCPRLSSSSPPPRTSRKPQQDSPPLSPSPHSSTARDQWHQTAPGGSSSWTASCRAGLCAGLATFKVPAVPCPSTNCLCQPTPCNLPVCVSSRYSFSPPLCQPASPCSLDTMMTCRSPSDSVSSLLRLPAFRSRYLLAPNASTLTIL